MSIPAENDGRLIAAAIRDGRALLVLGAGASLQCKNKFKKQLMSGKELAEYLAAKCGEIYAGDLLSDVMEVAYERLGQKQVHEIIYEQYCNCLPSDELIDLFSVPWKRVYTFNVDDSISNIPRKSTAQEIKAINGRAEKKKAEDSPSKLQVVHLHGRADNPSAGITFSKREYLNAIIAEKSDWYRQAASDYESYVPIFIGSKLDEDVLFAEIERISKSKNRLKKSIGVAFAFSPDDLTSIKKMSLEARGIKHCKMTLSDFNSWMQVLFPDGISASEVIEAKSFTDLPIEEINKADIEHLVCIRPIRQSDIADQVSKISEIERKTIGRDYYRGFYPSWTCVALGYPASLETDREFDRFISDEMSKSETRCIVLRGSAGSGKSTNLKRALYEWSRINPTFLMFELIDNPRAISRTLSILRRLYPSRQIIVIIDDLFLHAADVAEVADREEFASFSFIGSVRRGDWGGRVVKHIGKFSKVFDQKDLQKEDIERILFRMIEFVPSPYFQKLASDVREKIFSNARRQLLIGMVELTKEGRFHDIVMREFDRIPTRGAKVLFCIVGISTLARVGVSETFARACVRNLDDAEEFDSCLAALDGIVKARSDGRLFSRHEVYVREVFNGMSDFSVWSDALTLLLKEFATYEAPIIRNLGRQDGQLFRYVVNHSNIAKAFRRKATLAEGEALYRLVDIELQLDGHYWLQYGLYVQEIGNIDKCVEYLQKSIDAYPSNSFARHALAASQLELSKTFETFSGRAQSLVEESVAVLLELDARPDEQTDHYSIWTLVHGHLGVLVKFNQREKLREVAREYFDRVKKKRRSTDSRYLEICNESLLRLLSSDRWPPPPFDASGNVAGRSLFDFSLGTIF